MIEKLITVGLENGLEARKIALFVQEAGQFDSDIYVEFKNKKVNAKSIMGMMSLGVAKGDDLKVMIDGPDEEEAVECLEKNLSGEE